jgi:virulence-associated protein VagC
MNTTSRIVTIFDSEQGQTILLPSEFRIASLRRAGDAIILEPVKDTQWPEGFFESIRIDDPSFTRPDQGELPPVPAL